MDYKHFKIFSSQIKQLYAEIVFYLVLSIFFDAQFLYLPQLIKFYEYRLKEEILSTQVFQKRNFYSNLYNFINQV